MKCWEYMQCGRHDGGRKLDERGVCPAYPDKGSRCASVPGTLCELVTHGMPVARAVSCVKCDFYNSPFYEKKGSLQMALTRTK